MSTSPVLAERDALRTALEAREAELLELGGTLQREQDQSAKGSQVHEAALAELRAAFEQERVGLTAMAEVSSKEVDQVRRAFEREREELSAALMRREAEIAEVRLALGRERDGLQSQLKACEDELAVLRAASAREHEAFEAKRAELRSAFDRINQLRVQKADSPAVDGARAVVSKETLRQARAQFEFLAKECIRRGDVATQAMCELGAHTMNLVLAPDEGTHALPVGEVALSILRPDPASPVSAGT